MKTLKQAAIGDTVKVVKLHGEGAVKRTGGPNPCMLKNAGMRCG